MPDQTFRDKREKEPSLINLTLSKYIEPNGTKVWQIFVQQILGQIVSKFDKNLSDEQLSNICHFFGLFNTVCLGPWMEETWEFSNFKHFEKKMVGTWPLCKEVKRSEYWAIETSRNTVHNFFSMCPIMNRFPTELFVNLEPQYSLGGNLYAAQKLRRTILSVSNRKLFRSGIYLIGNII